MRKVIADLRQCPDREALHDVLAEAFVFPEYYGRNLDALYDLLTEVSEDTCAAVLFPAEEQLAEDEADTAEIPFSLYLTRLRHTFEDAEFENPRLTVLCLE